MSERTTRLRGLTLTEREFRLPLDHERPDGEHITVFAREAVATDKEEQDLPWLLFLQGGPGFGSPRPTERGGWLKRATDEFRVLLLDQRGTGRSTPACDRTLARLTDARAQADYLALFRADSIVRDAEWIRRELAGEERPWSVLGQSFGGFCALTYLSLHPEGLREVLFTGGLPPLEASVEDVYRKTFARVRDRNRRYYERYPADVERARAIADHLAAREVELPGGGPLSPRRFQQLGAGFGMSDGFEQVHYLIEDAFVAGPEGPELSTVFLRGIENALPFDTNPIYAALHEPCYCQGRASDWAAERVRAEQDGFDASGQGPLLFTGEMVFPWMFDEYVRLRPLKDAAEILARKDDWPPLYDSERLRTNAVPCAAAVYYDDMYVECEYSDATARAVLGMRTWVTNEYDHNGLRAHGDVILERLLALARGL